jgi:cell division septation protein DedD
MKMGLAFVVPAILLMAVTIEGQQDRTPFRVGIAVNSEDTTATDECTESEQAFLQSKLEAYIVSLGRLFFDDESLTLTEPLKEVSASHFSDLAFSDFNAYEAWKYDRATGNVINLNQLDALNVTITTADPIALPSDKNLISTTNSPATTSSPTTPMPTGPLPTPSGTNIMSSKPTSSPAMSPTVSPTASPTPVCSTVETCSTINFDTLPNGTRLSRGAYVSDEWNATYGLTITVKPTSTSGGYAPIQSRYESDSGAYL